MVRILWIALLDPPSPLVFFLDRVFDMVCKEKQAFPQTVPINEYSEITIRAELACMLPN